MSKSSQETLYHSNEIPWIYRRGAVYLQHSRAEALNTNSMKNRSSSLTTCTKGVTLALGCLLNVLKCSE